MADFDRSFSISEDGLSFDDNVGILAGADDPSSAGQAAPVGSLYIRADASGVLYIKTNTGDTDWSPVGAAGSGTTPRQVMCYTALRA